MSKTAHRQGGKFGGGHTTTTDTGALIADIAAKCPHVSTVSLGVITPGKGNGNGERKVKISDGHAFLLLTVRASGAIQEIRVYTKNMHETKLAISKGSRNNDITISFGDIRDTARQL